MSTKSYSLLIVFLFVLGMFRFGKNYGQGLASEKELDYDKFKASGFAFIQPMVEVHGFISRVMLGFRL